MIRHLIRAMRPHQWLKNTFVLAPLFFNRMLFEPEAWTSVLQTFLCFCLLSSATYLFNDLRDRHTDRLHPTKRHRPLASGALSINVATAAFILLKASGLALAWHVNAGVFLLAALYALLMLTYSLGLKEVSVLDSMLVAGGFVIRVEAGAVALGIHATHWLILCTFLLALYLAFAKRRQELLDLAEVAGSHRSVLNRYTIAYLDQVTPILLGTVVLSYALYTVAPDTVARFGTHALLYGTAFVIYALLRYLMLLHSSLEGDAIALLLRDRSMRLTLGLWILFNLAVIYHKAIPEIFGLDWAIR